jgi:hypothetical protein
MKEGEIMKPKSNEYNKSICILFADDVRASKITATTKKCSFNVHNSTTAKNCYDS